MYDRYGERLEIGIFGLSTDDEVKLIKKRIEQKGVKATVIDFHDFPANVSMYFDEKKIMLDGKNLLHMHAFYIRQLGYFWPVPQIELTKDQWEQYYGKYNNLLTNERENLSFKHSMIRMLDNEKFVVNPYDSFVFHRMKPYQFYLFQKHGLRIASFVSGSAKSIVKKYPVSSMVYKPLAGGAEVVMAQDFLKKAGGSLEKRAVLFQEQVKGDDIRVYALENEIIGSAKLLHGPQVDSRVEQLGVEVVTVPLEVKETALKAMELLGMKFSGIDFIRLQDGSYTLLECNPSPMFAGFEKMSKIPVSKKLVEYLMKNGES